MTDTITELITVLEELQDDMVDLNRIMEQDTSETPTYLCQSYFDDNNVLRDCTCGGCK